MRNVNDYVVNKITNITDRFILTMRNVNCCDRYKQCEEIECFILTMRNVNYNSCNNP
ncbi:TPA: hypothetical protein I9007_001569 [Clostridium perfringens]|nr:hypothetical protein [Clostridium perfringens]HAT4188574.1 hypothetical protein [Clostridium perfringens]HAT4194009.1 hypothetical protein [Clostridium perfringens]HAT4196408.1 hypothetical protein [Clostridium perfringens]HAT4206560.1 hypothetical protein [Clostridium perfringens]